MRAGRMGMAPKITVASTSLQSVIGDIDANMKKAKEVIAKAADRGAEVIVFPELFLPGYASGETDRCFDLSEPIPGPSTESLVTDAVRHKIYIAMGLIEADQEFHGVIHNTAVLVGPEGIVHVHRKVQLPEHMNLKELHYGFSPGDSFSVMKAVELSRLS